MKRHIFLLPFLMFAAAGCSGQHGPLASEDRAPAPQEPAAAQSVAVPAAAPEGSDDFCRRVAANAAADLAGNGFDEATRQRLALQSYQQCLTMGRVG